MSARRILAQTQNQPFWLRALAWFCAAFVLLLSLASVSPQIHAGLHSDCDHGHCHDDADPAPADHGHDCAVTLFAQGVTLFASFPALRAPDCQAAPSLVPHRDELLLSRPHAFTPPAQAPPFWSAAA